MAAIYLTITSTAFQIEMAMTIDIQIIFLIVMVQLALLHLLADVGLTCGVALIVLWLETVLYLILNMGFVFIQKLRMLVQVTITS
jgi:hypothetical protein